MKKRFEKIKIFNNELAKQCQNNVKTYKFLQGYRVKQINPKICVPYLK